MNKITTLSDKSIRVCSEALESIQKQKVKRGTSTDKKADIEYLLNDAKNIFEKAKEEKDEKMALRYLYDGFQHLYIIDEKMRNIKNSYSPIRKVFRELLDFFLENNNCSDDFHGIIIPIPLPSPESFINYIKQLLKG